MVHEHCDDKPKAYQGYLRDDCATIAEILKESGYRTLMTGKWHIGGEYPPDDPKHWREHAGDKHHPIPVQRGFDKHFGTLGGGGSYYDPPTLIRDDELILDTPNGFYYTDAINDEACQMIREAVQSGDEDGDGDNGDKEEENKPFFLYVAHTAPHWPLHAPAEAVAKYRGKYTVGWDEIRNRIILKILQLKLEPVKDWIKTKQTGHLLVALGVQQTLRSFIQEQTKVTFLH